MMMWRFRIASFVVVDLIISIGADDGGVGIGVGGGGVD
jgi:hypothetical protein